MEKYDALGMHRYFSNLALVISSSSSTVLKCKNVQLLHFFAQNAPTLRATRAANNGRMTTFEARN